MKTTSEVRKALRTEMAAGRRRTRLLVPSRPAPVAVAAVFVVLTLALPGCGNLTAGGASEVQLVLESDGEPTTQEIGGWASSLHSQSVGGEGPAGDALEVEVGPLAGEMFVTLSVSLVDADGQEVELTDGFEEVRLDLAAGSRTEIARTSVPPGDYDGFRVTFLRVEAEVTSSPGQSPFPPHVEVDLADDPLVVERGPGVSLGTDDAVRIVLDMRARTWVMAADPSDGRVARGVLRNAVRIQVEPVD
jgi:hypothetical protein